MVAQIIFTIITAFAVILFYKQASKIKQNIFLGKKENLNDNYKKRLKKVLLVAFGQSKLLNRPISGILHLIVYAGFILINIEVFEIIADGFFGTNRLFSKYLNETYWFAINLFEFLAIIVIISCVIFLIRRNIIKIKRFTNSELKGWPKKDANIILFIEIILMSALLILNITDGLINNEVSNHLYISSKLNSVFQSLSIDNLHIIERAAWWFHIIGIYAFLNYLPKSKHLHIILAFPTTYYSDLNAPGFIPNMQSVTNEVKAMFDPSIIPSNSEEPFRFGAKDITDLSWKSLLDAYTCTECGRCSSVCPANITGKLLSPRKIMMDTRDRLEEYSELKENNSEELNKKSLLGDYISLEEINACTTCNACTEACPININPLKIIVELRRYSYMEDSSVPNEWAMMSSNIENNGAPWQFPASDRANWTNKINS